MKLDARVLSPALLLGALLSLCAPTGARGQDPCPSASSVDAEAGWTAYREGDMGEARRRFETALSRCDNDQYARTGLGYVELRAGEEARAEVHFQTVLRAEPANVDARVGMGLLSWRAADIAAVRVHFNAVLELAPDHPTALEYLERIDGQVSTGPGAARPRSDEADAAWIAGNTDRAFELYRERLAADPDDDRALHRTALVHAWREEYRRSLELFDRLLGAAPLNLDARVDRARVLAWRGDEQEAMEELEEILAQDPDHVGALEARALLQAWAGRYEESLTSYERLLSISPDNGAARRQRAQVLSWASDFEGSRQVYEALLADDPDDVDARLGLARTLAYADELEGALAEYDRILAERPDHVGALQGKGRTLAWADRLVEGEEVLRHAVSVDADEPGSWVVLGQILQWQERDAAAKEALERAIALSPTNGEAHDQLRAVDLALSPLARPSTAYESDSDGNRMLTTSVGASWHPVPRLEVRADAYRRALEQNALERVSFGGRLTGVWTVEPGWRLTAGLGGTVTDGPGTPSRPAVRAAVQSPERHPVRGSLDMSLQTLDETAALADRGVRFADVTAAVRWKVGPAWRVDVSTGLGRFDGSDDNSRVGASLATSRRIGRSFGVGAGFRAFGYEKDLDDGYFDPAFYGIAELTGFWRHAPRPWSFLVEAAPGVQQVTRDGDPSFTLRGSGRVGYLVGAGRELSLSYGYSTAGLLSFSTGASDYHYSALILALSWGF